MMVVTDMTGSMMVVVIAIAGFMMVVVTAIAGSMKVVTDMTGAITRSVTAVSPSGCVAGAAMKTGTSVSTTAISTSSIAGAMTGACIAPVGANKTPRETSSMESKS